MFCPNCGNRLNGNEDFCPNCGFNIRMAIKNTPKKENIKKEPFIKRNKKLLLILTFIIIIISLFLILFNIFIGFENLSWNEDYEDNNLSLITQSNLTLGVNFDLNKKDKLKYKVSCGNLEVNDLEIKWNLTESIGKCKIEVSYKLKKITKEVKVVPFDDDKQNLGFEYKIDLDSDEDLDLDGLTNKQEKEYGTNPELYDSDLDGLDDYYEIFTSKTNPNEKDTDLDGLNDYDEIELGLDPLKPDSKGDGIKDGNRTLSYNYSSDDIKISITGKGNIASLNVNINEKTKISSKTGLIDKLYTLYTDGKIEKAEVTINYKDEELEKYNIDENNLTLFYFDSNLVKYEKIPTTIDKENKTIKATLNHFSNYVVGDSEKVKEKVNSQILFILDNSWSMYSTSQYEEITGEEYYGGLFGPKELDASDSSGKRFSLTLELASKLIKKGNSVGVSEFRGDYANALKIGSNEDALKNILNNMNGKFITKKEGTNISGSISEGIGEFTSNDDNKYIIILTDGQDTNTSLSRIKDKIIKNAQDKNVKVCSIGFGASSLSPDLSEISSATGCKFFSASNSDGLIELFDNMQTELNNGLVDTNNDNKDDGILIADSGFIVNRDGFSFENYGSNLSTGGHCYGMATFAELYYKNVLPLKQEKKVVGKSSSYAYNLNRTYFKNYSNLYDFKLKTNALKYEFGFNYFNEGVPNNFYVLDNDFLRINNKYKKEMLDSKLYEIEEIETSLSEKEQLESWGVTYKSAEKFDFNEDVMQKSYEISNDEKQMFNAIYTAFIKQDLDKKYSSGSNFMLWMRNLLGVENVEKTGQNSFINVLRARLQDKDPVVIASDYGHGWHAINAISLIQDKENPNLYKIGVYDNNYPGEKRYVDLECNNKVCVTKANEYYSGSNEVIRLTISLEHDLEYYK